MNELVFFALCIGITGVCMWGINSGRIWSAIFISSFLVFGLMVPMAANAAEGGLQKLSISNGKPYAKNVSPSNERGVLQKLSISSGKGKNFPR